MNTVPMKMKCVLALFVGGLLAAGPAMADKPAWAGAGKGGKAQQTDRRDEQKSERRNEMKSDRRSDSGASGQRHRFEERHREIVREYYGEQFRKGRCPPGLAKKNNGCLPPGQAKKWKVGHQLPRDVIFYDVPQQLVVQIGVPPRGYRYVRVANDILLIAAGTGMILDAIEDLSR